VHILKHEFFKSFYLSNTIFNNRIIKKSKTKTNNNQIIIIFTAQLSSMLNNYKLLFFIFILVLTSCAKEEGNINKQQIMESLKKITQEKWNQLSEQKIYFGRQSVGYNIMDGIEVILKENPNIKINIRKGHDANLFQNPVFAHDNVGSNRDPKFKIDDFCKTLENGLGNKVDIAGFKFCYVDIESGSDVKGIFAHYKKKMDEIAGKYPKVKIVHFTVPIKSLQSGVKGMIKKLLGKDIGLKDNMTRQEFNELLIKEYKDQSLFDLAKAESTYPNGKREFTEVNDQNIYTMIPAFTNDGGHLSKKGKLAIGSEFLIFLAELSDGGNN